MQQQPDAVLNAFAVHTRLRNESDTEVARKWLALHISPAMYQSIATDLPLLKLRTHKPALEHYYTEAKMDPATFAHVMQQGHVQYDAIKMHDTMLDMPLLHRFVDTLYGIPDESWQPFERNDMWKDRAYYVALARDVDLYPLVEAVYMTGLPESNKADRQHKDAVSDTYHRLLLYKRTHADDAVSGTEVAAIIGMLQLAHIENHGTNCGELKTQYEKEKAAAAAAASDNDEVDEPLPQQLADASRVRINIAPAAPPAQTLGWEQLHQHPDVQHYRKSANLSATFDTPKLAKQLVLARAGVKTAYPVHGRMQRALGTSAASWETVEHVLQHFDWTRVQLPLHDDAVIDTHRVACLLEHTNTPTALQLVKTHLRLFDNATDDTSALTQQHIQRFMKKHGSNGPSQVFINTILSL